MGAPSWQSLSVAELEREYTPSSMVASLAAELRVYAAASARTQAAHSPIELRYGPGPGELLDLYLPDLPTDRPAAQVPLLAFVHGGYWQELGKHDAAFPAAPVLARGAAYASIGYPLAPAASLAQIVDAVRRAVAWLHRHAPEHGIDPARIQLAGSSAGAHLAAEVLLHGRVPLRALTLLSGVYDLRPLVPTTVNHALGLTAEQAWELSPIRRVRQAGPPVLVAWGEIETAQFVAQSRAFAAALAAAGTPVQTWELAGLNHFDNVFALTDPATPVGAATLSVLEEIPR
ncbi:alpha/beta hydrolase [Nonomuraea sp. NPDC050310]|uniref:alpha/beta hydrolase n=1 Tax=Nonomuraea sp. NPDC050310 TaxID=3154935 RepID=UPI00340BF6B0